MLETRYGLLVTVENRSDNIHVVLEGELDMSTVSILIDAFGTVDPVDQTGILVDITALGFLGACGMNAIVVAAGRFALSCRPLMVVGASPSQQHSLVAAGFASLLAKAEVRSVVSELGSAKPRPRLIGVRRAS